MSVETTKPGERAHDPVAQPGAGTVPSVPSVRPPADSILGPVGPPTGSWPARHRYALLALIVTVLTGIQTLNGQWSSDMWEHVAVVRELIAHPFDPNHPLVLSDAAHPDFSPYTVVLGMVGHLLGVGAVTVLSVAGVVNVVLLLVALRLLVIEVTGNERAPFWALLFTLALWGASPYRYSGFYSLNSIGFVAPYPSTFATAVAFGTLVAALRFARTGERRRLVAVSLGTAVVVLVHPLSAPWFALAMAAVALSRQRDLRAIAWFGGVGAVGVGLCLVWPYYPLVDLVNSSADLESLNQTMYSSVVPRILPALLGLAVVVRRSRADHLDLLGLFLAGSAGLYLLGALSDNTSFGRSLAFVVVVLHIALADGVARFEAGATLADASRGARVGVGVIGFLLLVGLVTTRAGLVRMVPEALLPASIRGSDELVRPDDRYRFLVGPVGPTEVVAAATPSDNRIIPALTGRSLALAVPRPFVTDADARKRAQRRFFDPATSAHRRAEIQDEFQVRFALLHIDEAGRALLRILTAGGATVVHRDDELVLVELAALP